MTKFKKDDLINLERLSRISLNPEDEECFIHDIAKILSYMEMLQEVDTENTPTLTHPIKNMYAPLREDIPEDLLPTKEFLSNAPKSCGSFVKVPVVIEGKEEK